MEDRIDLEKSPKLSEKILKFLEENPGQKVSVIAHELGTEKKEINTLLYGELNKKCTQDKTYRWFLMKDAQNLNTGDTRKKEVEKTVLANLCHYYMACIGQDDESGVSVFAANKFNDNDLDYLELDNLPIGERQNNFSQNGVQRLIGKIRKDKSRLIMYFGYPTTLKKTISKKSSWEGFFVEPIFLFPIEINGNGLSLSKGLPIINSNVIKRFSNAENEQVISEIVQLEQELGLTDEGDMPDLDELAQRLVKIRDEWPWAEEIDPYHLSKEPALSEIHQEGAYNRGVLIVTEKKPYTEGLEAELKALTELREVEYKNSVLCQWANEKIPEMKNTEPKALLEVLPLNLEQRRAVSHALNNSLTIITGPPGTGKSQVVTDLIINAVWQGKKVLFASKNNKAVDVVEARINNISPQPILIRMGSGDYQSKLAEYLLSLLSSVISEDDQEIFEKNKNIYEKIESKLIELEKQENELITNRNKVDQLDQIVDNARLELSKDVYEILKNIDIKQIKNSIAPFRSILRAAIKEKQAFFIKIIWPLIKNRRYKNLEDQATKAKKQLSIFGIVPPKEAPYDLTIKLWEDLLNQLDNLVNLAEYLHEYLAALKILQKTKSLEIIDKEKMGIISRLASSAEVLWNQWLRLRPSKLSASDRRALNSYRTILKMVIESGSDLYKVLGKKYYFEYKNLSGKVAHLLPAWAVTSLAARGKIPFVDGFFDLVIFDEASQCDIASALPLLFRAKNAVIIGDPNQLKNISTLKKGEDKQLLEKHDLVKYSNWAYSYNSLYDLASGFVSGNDVINLQDHHRSHADIIEFSNAEFYKGNLRVATNYDRLKLPDKEEPGIRWIDVSGTAIKPAGASGAINEKEGKKLVNEIKKLVGNSYAGTIGVVTPFRAQANLIRKLVNDDNELSLKLINNNFLVDVVHKFQGDERDIIFFSPVISDNTPFGSLLFLKNNGNLFNVAITRARAMLIVVGDLNIATKCDVSYLEHFARYVQQLQIKKEEKINFPTENLGEDYPTVTHPEKVSEWEHIFYKALYKSGIRPIPQYQIEKYILDFALFNGERKLNIEVDGEYYHRNWTGELCRRDQIRNQRMMELGWDVLRFWVYEIRDDMDGCMRKVKEWQAEKQKTSIISAHDLL